MKHYHILPFVERGPEIQLVCKIQTSEIRAANSFLLPKTEAHKCSNDARNSSYDKSAEPW